MLLVSDVHGEFEALAEVAGRGEVLLILGDLINLLDYRTNQGIIADVMGSEFASEVGDRRGRGDYAGMRSLWGERVLEGGTELRQAIESAIRAEYGRVTEALRGTTGFCTFGNVDRPEMLQASLPEGWQFVDGVAVVVDGMRVGFVGGGVATPIGASGEVTEELMEAKLESIGPVEILCSHLPPAIDPLRTDVITGRGERGSRPLLDYIRRQQPRYHFFGDVHQPQASIWRVGKTTCRNLGYFRATKRPVSLDGWDRP
ncbi:MAG TPA: metallophosphoesterase [Acidimicrobiia bacterium]